MNVFYTLQQEFQDRTQISVFTDGGSNMELLLILHKGRQAIVLMLQK